MTLTLLDFVTCRASLPTPLIFDVLSEFEVKIDQKHDFGLILQKVKKSVISKISNFFVKTLLKHKVFSIFLCNRTQST
jgi:hypothetical protein